MLYLSLHVLVLSNEILFKPKLMRLSKATIKQKIIRIRALSELHESKKEGKDQEPIQFSSTPDPGYQWESDNVTIRHHK